MMQRIGDLGTHVGPFLRSGATIDKAILKRGAGNEVADDVERIVFPSHLVNAHDVRMAQLGGRLGLTKEPFDALRIQVSLSRNLNGDRAIQFLIGRAPNGAETPCTDPFQKLEMPQCSRLAV